MIANVKTMGFSVGLISFICGLLTTLFGVMAIAGWIFNIPILASLDSSKIPMAPSTALFFTIYGILIIAHRHFKINQTFRSIEFIIVILGFLISSFLLVSSSSKIYFNAEHLGFSINKIVNGIIIGHMSPVTAFCFLLISISFLFAYLSYSKRSLSKGSTLTSILVILISYILILSYIFGTPLLYEGSFIPPALPTSISFLCLGIALQFYTKLESQNYKDSTIKIEFNSANNLILIFVILFLGIITAGYSYYKGFENKHRREVENQLIAISESKIDALIQWQKQRTGDANVVSKSPFFIGAIKQWLIEKNNSLLRKNLKTQLNLVKINYGYEDIILTSAAGRFLLCTNQDTYTLGDVTLQKITQAVHNKQLAFTDFYFCTSHNEIHYDIIAPIYDENKEILASIILQILPEEYLYPLIQSWSATSKSSETLIVRRERDKALFLNELRHIKNTALNLSISLTRTEVPAVQAVLGKQGIFDGKDYRGVEVVSYIMPIENTPWFMVAKVDKDEIFSELKYRAILISILTGVLILLGGIGISLIYYSRQKNNYLNLFLKEKEISESHEKFKTTLYSIGDGVIITDQLGIVKNMNPIAEQLTGWREHEASGLPLVQIFNIINEDTREKVENPVIKVLANGLIVGLANHTLLISKDGTEIAIADSGAPIKSADGEISGVVLVFRDQGEERLTNRLLNSRLHLYEFAKSHSFGELLTKTLDEVEAITKSSIGFYHFVLPDQETLRLQSWSTKTEKEFCKTEGKGPHYNISEAGVWIEAIQKRKPVVHNDYSSLPNKKGMPEGHAPVIRELVVPVIKEDKIVAVIGVGNKSTDYTNKDIEVVSFLGDVAWELVVGRRAEETLLNLSSRQTAILDSVPDIIMEVDINKIYTWANNAGFEFFGDDVIGKEAAFYFEGEQQTYNNVQPLFNGSENIIYVESWQRRRDGEIRLLAWWCRVLKDLNGNVTGALSTARDITEQKKAEKEIALLTHSIERSVNEIYILDAATLKFRYVNSGGQKNIGYTLAELKEMTPLDIQPEFTEQIFTNLIAPLLSKFQDNMLFETIHRRKDGSTYSCEVRLQLFDYENDKVFLAVVQDITERKKAEVALHESEEKLRLLIEHAPAALAMFDREMRYIAVSHRWISDFHLQETKLIGRSHYEVFPEIGEELKKIHQRGLNGETIKNDGDKFERADGSVQWLRWEMRPWHTAKGSIGGIVIFSEDITEHKLFEDALKESEEKYRTLFDAAAEGILVADVEDKVFKYANPAMCKMLGYSEEEILQLTVLDIHPKESLQYVLNEFQAVARSEYRAITNIPCLRKDGSIFYVEINGQPVMMKGRLMNVGLFTDVTERKNAEQALKNSEALYHSLVEHLPASIFRKDPEGRYVFVNSKFCRLKGLTNEEIIGKTPLELASYELSNDAQLDASTGLVNRQKTIIQGADHHRMIMKSGKNIELEEVYEQPDRTSKYYQVIKTPIFDRDGKIIGSQGIQFDVTDRKNAEEEIIRLNDRLQQLIQVIQKLASAATLENIIEAIRSSARTLINADGTTFILREENMCYYVDEDAISPLWKGQRFPIEKCISGWVILHKQSVVIEDIYMDERIPQDAYRPTFVKSLMMVPIHTVNPYGAIGIYWANNYKPEEEEKVLIQTLADATAIAIENVRNLEDLEKRVHERTTQLETSNKELEAFSYTVSHDLRAPLRAILGFSRILEDEYKDRLNEEGIELLNDVISNSNKMSQLIDDLLTFSRLSRREVSKNLINMGQLFIQTFEELKILTPERNIHFKMNHIPYGHGDLSLLKQVVINLLSNAIKFSAKNEEAILTVDGKETEEECLYSVSDNGVGFDMKYLDKIFGVFQRLHSAAEFDGTGVGLAIVHRIVTRHGGRVWAEAEINKGATFYFTLPKK